LIRTNLPPPHLVALDRVAKRKNHR